MATQTTQTVLMIEPVAFGYNAETAVNNYFQQPPSASDTTTQSPVDQQAILRLEGPSAFDTSTQTAALAEFKAMVNRLGKAGINVITICATPEPRTPDSIFPNNWISFHENGLAVLYPMYAENRRAERRTDVFSILKQSGNKYTEIFDLTSFEHQKLFLEGTGSMVLDRRNKIAYAALSERTHSEVLEVFCKNTGYKALTFHALQQVGDERLPIYHTNVMMCVAEQFAVVCLESIDDEKERQQLTEQLEQTQKDIVEISGEQMHRFAGNMLQLRNGKSELKLVLSGSAYQSLNKQQINQLQSYNELIVCEVPTIEKYGGGSVRCMIAELF